MEGIIRDYTRKKCNRSQGIIKCRITYDLIDYSAVQPLSCAALFFSTKKYVNRIVYLFFKTFQLNLPRIRAPPTFLET